MFATPVIQSAAINPMPVTPAEIERRFCASQARLLRLARLRGVCEAVVEDVVQETWLEAWKSLDHLRDPNHFDAWLDGICRNVCHRHTASLRQPGPFGATRLCAPLPEPDEDDVGELADATLLDPIEELDRRELATLLDRALGYLPELSREAMTLCYLEELPQREVAARMAVTIGALEERLRRARKLLRETLTTALRADAEAFGLTLSSADHSAWRETRLWCPYCGQARLVGAFTRPDDGGKGAEAPGVFLYCPNAQGHPTIANAPRDEMRSLVAHVQGLTSFRPILKRMMRDVSSYYTEGAARGWAPCRRCGAPAPLRLRPIERWQAGAGAHQLDVTCATCGASANEALPGLALALPAGNRFWQAHPRMRMLPVRLITFKDSPALLISFESLGERARLDVIAARDAFRILAVEG